MVRVRVRFRVRVRVRVRVRARAIGYISDARAVGVGEDKAIEARLRVQLEADLGSPPLGSRRQVMLSGGGALRVGWPEHTAADWRRVAPEHAARLRVWLFRAALRGDGERPAQGSGWDCD